MPRAACGLVTRLFPLTKQTPLLRDASSVSSRRLCRHDVVGGVSRTMATTQFDNVYHGNGKALGMIRFSQAGLGWKPLDEGSTVTIPADQMTAFAWLRVARNFQLKIKMKGDGEGEHVATFENFQREDHARLEQVLRECYDKALETIEISTRGWNWGSAEVGEHDMLFYVKNRLAFSLPLANIANSNIAGRTEVSMEFINPKDQRPEQNTGASSGADGLQFHGSKKNRPDQLVEMRLYIPGQAGREEDDEDENDNGQDSDIKNEPSAGGGVSKQATKREDGDERADDEEEEEEEEEVEDETRLEDDELSQSPPTKQRLAKVQKSDKPRATTISKRSSKPPSKPKAAPKPKKSVPKPGEAYDINAYF